MHDKLIVNLCPTGMMPRRAKVPAVPISPAEVAADVRRCRDAGAAMVHLHARNENEEPTWRLDRYQELCDAVASAVPDIIIVATTSGRNWSEISRRSESLQVCGPAKPEMASLTLGSMNFPTGPSINSPETIQQLAEEMTRRGIVPELEIFDTGMADYARLLADQGVLGPPFYANILLGSRGTAALSAANVAAILAGLPRKTTWALAGIGSAQTASAMVGMSLGGHVRVGLEDNPYYDWMSKSSASNPRLVERIVRLGRELGREPTAPDEARALIGLSSVSRTASAHQ